MSTVIKVEGLSKLYRLGEVGTGTLSHDLRRWWYRIRGKEDPYLKLGQVNDRTQRAENGELVWALRDITFEVKEGDVLGIIGRNGAGKSTLLKILSRITSPTEGVVKVKGRVASLLEVGTGFHPELTGRENIYMNGTIMGMRRAEIDRRLDEIVEFAGVAKYLDTPVKRYSSGMTVRLGFAVAAHLNAEILLVDEVLAVGDAEFQKKALGKMHEVSHDQGRTVLFVSHNMGAVEALCTTGMVLSNGCKIFEGDAKTAVARYLADKISLSSKITARRGKGDVIVTDVLICDENFSPIDVIPVGSTINVILKFVNKKPGKYYNIIPSVGIKNYFDAYVSNHHSRLVGKIYHELPEKGQFILTFKEIPLVPSTYYIHYALVENDEIQDMGMEYAELTVINGNFYSTGQTIPASHGMVMLKGDWDMCPVYE